MVTDKGFDQRRMNGGHRYGDDALNLDDHTTVASTLPPKENTLLPFELTTGDTHARAFGEIQLFGGKIE